MLSLSLPYLSLQMEFSLRKWNNNAEKDHVRTAVVTIDSVSEKMENGWGRLPAPTP